MFERRLERSDPPPPASASVEDLERALAEMIEEGASDPAAEERLVALCAALPRTDALRERLRGWWRGLEPALHDRRWHAVSNALLTWFPSPALALEALERMPKPPRIADEERVHFGFRLGRRVKRAFGADLEPTLRRGLLEPVRDGETPPLQVLDYLIQMLGSGPSHSPEAELAASLVREYATACLAREPPPPRAFFEALSSVALLLEPSQRWAWMVRMRHFGAFELDESAYSRTLEYVDPAGRLGRHSSDPGDSSDFADLVARGRRDLERIVASPDRLVRFKASRALLHRLPLFRDDPALALLGTEVRAVVEAERGAVAVHDELMRVSRLPAPISAELEARATAWYRDAAWPDDIEELQNRATMARRPGHAAVLRRILAAAGAASPYRA
jgi:hypothetical protein